DAQYVLNSSYDLLRKYAIFGKPKTDGSANRLLIDFCMSPWLDSSLCTLQVYGSIFGSNCSIAYSSSCTSKDPLNKKFSWDAP
ncbi:hypothetical protein AAVH_30127, partial [Aphelenchoides avenae]